MATSDRPVTAALPPDPAEVTEELREALWFKVAQVRDAAPRRSDDADSYDVVDAILPVIAATLAAERAAVTRPLLALAEELEGWRANAERYADAHAGSIACDRALGRVRAYERAITRLRAVTAALGETGGGQ